METSHRPRFRGPHGGVLAILFMLLFLTGLSFVISLNGKPPYYPGPWEAAGRIVAYFQQQPRDVLLCSFFQFCSAIPLGLLAVTMAGRLNFLGVRAAGPNIALFGGFLTCVSCPPGWSGPGSPWGW
jgi:hypothetical protein